jgi:hypothetical protein
LCAEEFNHKWGEVQDFVRISLPYKCHCEAVFAEAIFCFKINFAQKEIAAPPKCKSGGSQ